MTSVVYMLTPACMFVGWPWLYPAIKQLRTPAANLERGQTAVAEGHVYTRGIDCKIIINFIIDILEGAKAFSIYL